MSVDFGEIKRPARERLLELLFDLEWHSNLELQRAAGIRYGARVLELKRLGYQIVTDGQPENGLRYRLTSRERGPQQGKRVKVLLHERDADELLALAVRFGTIACAEALRGALISFHANRGKL